MSAEDRLELNRQIAVGLGLPLPVPIVEPVTVRLVMELLGEQAEYATQFPGYPAARATARQDCTMRGSVQVTVVGADGALLASWSRTDNLWHGLAEGRVYVAEGVRVCSCGGTPDIPWHIPEHFYREQTMGWFWVCERCGGGDWRRVSPTEAGAPSAPAA